MNNKKFKVSSSKTDYLGIILTPMPINCSLLCMRGWLSVGMVVIQSYISVSKLKKTKTKFLRCTGYLNSINPL